MPTYFSRRPCYERVYNITVCQRDEDEVILECGREADNEGKEEQGMNHYYNMLYYT